MSLLAGILGFMVEPAMSASVTTYGSSVTGTSSMSVTGANAGQLYVMCHTAYNSSGISSAPSTPTGFTSITSYATSGNKMSMRISYKLLTSNDANYSLPSVAGATAQTVIGFVYSVENGSFSSISTLPNSWLYVSNSPTLINVAAGDVAKNDIYIGIGNVESDIIGASFVTETPNASNQRLGQESEIPLKYVFSIHQTKIFDTSRSFSWSVATDGVSAGLSNVIRLRPTFF